MAKYKYNKHIAPAFPFEAYNFAYRFIDKNDDYLALWLSNTPFVYAQYAGFPTYSSGWCLPIGAPTPTIYVYHIGVDTKWWKSSVIRTHYDYSDDFDPEWIVCHATPSWSNVDIYNEEGTKVMCEGTTPTLYCPDPPVIQLFGFNLVSAEPSSQSDLQTIVVLPYLEDGWSKYLYNATTLCLKAYSPDNTFIKAQIYKNGRLIGETTGDGTLSFTYKPEINGVGRSPYHAVLTSYYQTPGTSPSLSVTSQTVYEAIIEYNLDDYDPNTGTDTTGQLTPGAVVPTTSVDTGSSTVGPSDNTYQDPTQDPIYGEVGGEGTDDDNIDIDESDPVEDVVIDDITQEIILKDSVSALSYYLGYQIGKIFRNQRNGEDVDAELIDGVLYIRNANAEQTDTLLEVT